MRIPRTAPRRSRAATAALGWVAMLCMLGGSALPAQGAEVPVETQVPILFKMLTYDRTLAERSGETIHLGILSVPGNEASRNGAAAFADVLRAQQDKTVRGRPFAFVTVAYRDGTDLPAVLAEQDVDVLYVPRGCGGVLDEVRSAARASGVLTLAADADDVRDGLSIGLELKDDRPRIVVNLEALHQEGHDLESRALRLCEVITRP